MKKEKTCSLILQLGFVVAVVVVISIIVTFGTLYPDVLFGEIGGALLGAK